MTCEHWFRYINTRILNVDVSPISYNVSPDETERDLMHDMRTRKSNQS